MSHFLKSFNKSEGLLRHISLNLFFKGGSILINFLFVPISIRLLGTEQYGIWLTLFSFISWFNFFDFGLGHGLRNHLSKAISDNNEELARKYVSNAYSVLIIISLALALLFFLIFNYVDWQGIFKINDSDLYSFKVLLKIVFLSFFINLVLRLVNSISLSLLNASYPGMLNFLNNILSFLIIYVFLQVGLDSLKLYGFVIMSVQTLILIIANFVLFSSSYKHLSPRIFSFNKSIINKIFGLGGKFFIIQIAMVVIWSTDNLIITQIFSPKDVTTYNVAFKYFGVVTMLSSLVLTPFWSKITKIDAVGNRSWIEKYFKYSFIGIAVASFGIFVMYLSSDYIYKLWIGESIIIPKTLTLMMGLNALSMIVLQVLFMYINGIGKIKLQFYLYVVLAVVNIPLSIYLAKDLSYGITGVIMGTIICNLVGVIIYPIQVIKLINNRAYGIWNK